MSYASDMIDLLSDPRFVECVECGDVVGVSGHWCRPCERGIMSEARQ